MRRRGSIQTAVLVLVTVAVTTASTTTAVAVPMEWHDSFHPRPMRGVAVATVRSGGRSAWSTIAAASETVGGMMRATVGRSAGERDEGALRGVFMRAVSCVVRAGCMVMKGVPLPRAAAGAAVESLIGPEANDDASAGNGTNEPAGTSAEVDSERSHDAHSR